MKKTIGYYDKEGKPIGTLVWAKLFEDKNYRTIKQTTLPNKKWVSTVWLGLDHSFMNGEKPLIFETMVFARKFTKNFERNKKLAHDLDSMRYSTLKEAIEGHRRMCRRWVKKKIKPSEADEWAICHHVPIVGKGGKEIKGRKK